MKINDPKLLHFSHLLVEQKGKYFYENEDIQRTHEILDTVNCFSNIGVEYRSVFPIKIKTRPCVIVLRRRAGVLPFIEPTVMVLNADLPNVESLPVAAKLEQFNGKHSEMSDLENSADSENHQFIEDSEIVDVTENENDEETDETNENNEEIDENVNINDNYDTNDDAKNADASDDEENIEDEVDENLNPSENGGVNDDEQNIVETDLKTPTKETKYKLKRLIERHYRLKAAKEPPNDRTDIVPANPNRPSIKSNIKHIIKKEKIKELIEKISQIDLRTVCDLERQTTKQCLLKIIDSFID